MKVEKDEFLIDDRSKAIRGARQGGARAWARAVDLPAGSFYLSRLGVAPPLTLNTTCYLSLCRCLSYPQSRRTSPPARASNKSIDFHRIHCIAGLLIAILMPQLRLLITDWNSGFHGRDNEGQKVRRWFFVERSIFRYTALSLFLSAAV